MTDVSIELTFSSYCVGSEDYIMASINVILQNISLPAPDIKVG